MRFRNVYVAWVLVAEDTTNRRKDPEPILIYQTKKLCEAGAIDLKKRAGNCGKFSVHRVELPIIHVWKYRDPGKFYDYG